MYLTYDEYIGMGGNLDEVQFRELEFKACKRIDSMTFMRVRAMKEVPYAVKRCIFSLLRLESTAGAETQAEKPAVTSYSTDGYSETYANTMSAAEAEKQMGEVIRTDLYGEKDDKGVPLLYRGVY